MSDWIPSVDNPGHMEKTIQKGAATIIIFRPVLSDEERTEREGKARAALQSALRENFIHRRKTT